MGYHKLVLKPGNGTDKPKKSDTVTIQYTGNLYDESKGKEQHYRGSKFDSSEGRGDFKTEIGVGKVIRGSQRQETEASKLSMANHNVQVGMRVC
ncbi:MAG: hypothetical protein MMC23_009838 [Stictis urceolatum]|nr:hypothetical protein [Stictis urceolata]